MHQEPNSMLVTAEVVHWIALCVMAVVYGLRLRWLFRFNPAMDRSAPGNPGQSNAKAGARHSLLNVLMPWAMESTRTSKGVVFWISFTVFHLGVVAGITLAFVSTLAPSFLGHPAVAWTCGGLLAGALLVAVYRVFRRLLRPVLRLVSTPDDYFSLLMLTGWFALGIATEAHLAGVDGFANQGLLVAYLYLTSFFLLYVPFSKISHYLYYPFTRLWIGRALGRRGSYPYSRA